MKAYKGFNKDMTCRGFQYEEGKTYEEDSAKLCEYGFHACENPIDCLGYYPLSRSVYHEVELDGVTNEKEHDTKRVGTKITVKAALDIKELISATFEYVKSHCTNNQMGKDYSALTDYDYSALKGGCYSALMAGCYSALKGGYGATLKSDNCSALSGDIKSVLVSGHGSALRGGHISVLKGGDYSALKCGSWSVLTSGNNSALRGGAESALTGGDGSVVYGGTGSIVRGGVYAVLAVGYFNDNDEYRIAFTEVDGEKIKADTWYRLDANHEFVEVE